MREYLGSFLVCSTIVWFLPLNIIDYSPPSNLTKRISCYCINVSLPDVKGLSPHSFK